MQKVCSHSVSSSTKRALKRLALLFSLLAVGASLVPLRLAAEGEDNPTGVAGFYNGNVDSAGSYDPLTGNAMRMVDDIVVPGAVGAYPLKWTRYFNSRSNTGLWTFSYSDYGLYPGPSARMIFPDGRLIWYRGQANPPDPTGIPERIGTWNNQDAIFLADGGVVVFGIVNGSSRIATQLIDPYGQITTFTRDASNRLTRVTEPGGRYLQLTWTDFGGYIGWQIASVQSFDGIVGHSAIETVTYSWGQFNHQNGQHTPKLNSVAYGNGTTGDGTTATYTYDDKPTSNTPNSPRKLVLDTCDDVRYAGPMRQIKYQYGQDGKLEIEKNKVTGEVVSSLFKDNVHGTAHETRGDGAGRTFTYPPVFNQGGGEWEPDPAIYGKMLTYTDFVGNLTTFEYEPEGSFNIGFLKKATDANGHSTSYTRQTGSWGITRITHDADLSYISQTFWPNNSQTSPYYLASRTNELGRTTTYTRDSNNRITRKDYSTPDPTALDPSPLPVYETFDYSNNQFGLVGSHRMTNGQTEGFIYDARGLKTSWTDGTGGVTSYEYYASGPWTDRLKKITKPLNNSNLQQTETYEYDKSFDANGVETTTSCPGRGVVTKIIHTDLTTVTYTHNKWGDVLTDTDELGHVATTNTYDEYGRVLTTTTSPRFLNDTMNHTTSFSYVPSGFSSSRITTSKCPWVTTLPSGKVTKNYYDAGWRKTRLQQAPGVSGQEANTYFYYDSYAGYTSKGHLLATKDPRNYVTKYHFDSRDRQDQITDALGASLGDPFHTTFFTFDVCGNKLTETRARPDATTNPEVITFFPDKLNRVKMKTTKRSDAITDIVNMAYDTANNLAKFQDENATASGNTTQIYVYTYDGMNRKKRTTYPNGLYEESLYDPVGNIATYRNRSTNVQTFTYDNRNRATGFSWDDGATSSQSTFYDLASRVTQVSNNISTINHVYFNDNLLNTQEEWTSQFSDNIHRTLTYTYDPDGNRANVQYPSGTAFNYGYTARNQLGSIQPGLSGGNSIVSYTYDVSGNITGATRDNGTTSAFTVDAVNRETAAVHTLVGTTRRFDYAYNNVHDITVVQRDSGLGDGYAYDFTQEITNYYQNGTVNLTNGTITNPVTTNNMLFDGCGNRTSLNSVAQTFDNMNQITGATFNHDSKGNLCTNGIWGYTYDAQNRLTHAVASAKGSTTTADFYYDAKNRQIARSINNSIVTFSVWDDWELVEEYTNGNIRMAGYLQGAHGPIKSLITPNNYFYQDSLGSTSHLASSTGALLEYYKYDLNGKPTYWNPGGTQITATAFAVVDLFAGERYIPEIGLYDDRNRFYIPDLGRFLQPDPIGFKGDASNLYRYCGNDWANKTDSTGLQLDQDLFGPGDRTGIALNTIAHESGTWTLGGHGSDDGRYVVLRHRGGYHMSPKEIVKEARKKDPDGFQKAKRIIVYVCNGGNTGLSDNPLAAAIAKEAKKYADGATTLIFPRRNGTYEICPALPHKWGDKVKPDSKHPGKWNTFDPDGNQSGSHQAPQPNRNKPSEPPATAAAQTENPNPQAYGGGKTAALHSWGQMVAGSFNENLCAGVSTFLKAAGF
jgi:RHS repeat-associated protein